MRTDNKILYEKIMRNVSREVKRALNEDAIESNELDDASNDTIVIRKDMMNPGKTDYDYCKTIFNFILSLLLSVPSTPFNFKKEIILDDTFKNVFNDLVNDSSFSIKLSQYYKKDPTLIKLGKYIANEYEPQRIDSKYSTLKCILIIKKNIPDLLNQLKKHPKMKNVFQTRNYLPDYYFNDFSNCKFHPNNAEEFGALVDLYINTECIKKQWNDNKFNDDDLAHFLNDVDLSLFGSKMENLIYNMGMSTKKIIGKLSKYNNVNILDVCEEFKNNYPELWEDILNDIKTNGKKCLFTSLYTLVLDEYRGNNYKTVGSVQDSLYISAFYPDLFGDLLEIRDTDLYKDIKFYMTECKKFPVINKQSDVNKLDPNDFILTYNKWDWDIELPSYDIYETIIERQFEYNDIDSTDALHKIFDTLRKNQLEWVKQYLKSNGVEGATISKCIINKSNYKEYVLNDNDPLKMAYEVTAPWSFGM